MFDVAPVADGAAAVILTRRELLARRRHHPLVRISGSSQVTDRLALHDREICLDLTAARISVERACRQAGIRLADVDLFELYDLLSIYRGPLPGGSRVCRAAAGLAAGAG